LTPAPTGELDTGHLATSIRISSLPLSEDLAKLMVKPLSDNSTVVTLALGFRALAILRLVERINL